MNMKQRWNDIDREQLKASEENLSQCNFVHQKSHIEWNECEPGSLRSKKPATNRTSYGASLTAVYVIQFYYRLCKPIKYTFISLYNRYIAVYVACIC
jgi:hypothetical protein